MLESMKIRDGEELEDMLGVQRLRMVYEDMVFKVTGKVPRFPVLGAERHAANNYKNFLKIHRHIRAINVTPELYLSVMFTRYGSPKPDRRGRVWKYPYLQWLSSDKAFEAFVWRARGLASRYGYKSVKDVLRKGVSIDYTPRFKNAFLTGFHILTNVKEAFEEGFLDRDENRFAAFLAYSDTFSPEFVTTAEGCEEFLTMPPDTNLGKMYQEKVLDYVTPVLERGWKKDGYFESLCKARNIVAARERKILEKRKALTVQKGRDVWLLLQ